MLHAIVPGTHRLLRLVAVIVCTSPVGLLASPTTAYDSYGGRNNALLVGPDIEGTPGRTHHLHHHLRSRHSPAASPVQDDPSPSLTFPVPADAGPEGETLPVQQQLLGGVTRVPWYGLTELSDVFLFAVLVTAALLGILLFVVLVLGVRAKLQLQRVGDGLPLTADYVQQPAECSGVKCTGVRTKAGSARPDQPIVLLETNSALYPIPATCVQVTGGGDATGPEPSRGRRRAEQQLNLSDKRHHSPAAHAAPLPAATVTMSASVNPASSNSSNSQVGDDKENCVHRAQPDPGEDPLPAAPRNVLKRQPVAELTVGGPPGTPGTGSPTTFILTPSSASSHSTSATTTDNNATPTKGVAGGLAGGPLSAAESMAAARFGFSPRSIHSFTVQTATYFRFPDVDDFTPTPRTLPATKRPGTDESSSTPPAVDAHTEEEGDANQPPPVDAPKVSIVAPSPGSLPLPPVPPREDTPPESESVGLEEPAREAAADPPRPTRMCAPMASRRVRLKSISLDSEGARLVEENLTSTIPVQELVGMAAHRSGGFDCVVDDDDDEDVDDDEGGRKDGKEAGHIATHRETDEEEEEAALRMAARAKRVRNILNLRLDIPPLPMGTGTLGPQAAPPPPAVSQSTGSVAKPIVRTVAVSGSVSNPTMSSSAAQPQPQLPVEEGSEQFYFEYYDYGDDEDETDDEYDGVEYGEEPEDNNNNGNGHGHRTGALPPVPKTPTLSQSKQKASSLDSDKLRMTHLYGGGMSHSMSIAQSTSGQNMSTLSFAQPPFGQQLQLQQQHQQHQQQQAPYGQFQFHHPTQQHQTQQHQQQHQFHLHQQTAGQLQQPRRVSSVSVPTTPKRYQYRTAANHHYYHHQQQQQQHYASGQSKLKPSYHPGPASDTTAANGNRKEKKSPLGLKAVPGGDNGTTPQSQSPSDRGKPDEAAKAPAPTGGRSSILQRRGSNHSLTLNLDVYHRGGSVDLTSSSCSLYRGSYKNLHQVQSHSQLYQPHQADASAGGGSVVRVQCHQASPQQQQQQQVTSSASSTAVHSSSGNLNNNNASTSKKNLLQRRGSNTSLTLNLRSGVGSGAGGGVGGGSTFGLNRFSSHNSLNTTHMSALSTINANALGTGGQQQQQQQQQQQHGSSSMVRPAGSRKSLLERRNSNASLTLINVNQRTLSVSNCNLRGSICSLNSLLTTHTQNEPPPSGMMLEEDELDGNGDNDHHHHHYHHHHPHHHHHGGGHHHHGQHHHGSHHRTGGDGELRRFGSSVDASFPGTDAGTSGVTASSTEGRAGDAGRSCGYGRLTVGPTAGSSTEQTGCREAIQGGHGVVATAGRQRKFRSSDSLHNINVREQGMHGCEMMMAGRHHQHQHLHQPGMMERQLEREHLTEAKLMTGTFQQRGCQSSFDERHHYGSSENFKEHQNKLSTHRGLFQKDPSTVTSTSSANNLSALGTGSLYNCCSSCCCGCGCCCCCGANMDGGGCFDENRLVIKTGNLSISNSNVRNISTKPLSPQTTSEDFKIYLANIQFLQNASNVLTIAYLRKLHNFFSKTYRKTIASVSAGPQESVCQRRKSKEVPGEAGDAGQSKVEAGSKMMLLHSDSLHHPPVCDDESYDEEHKQMVLKIHQEFWDLPTNYQEKPMVFGSQAKNRYKTILPNEHSRVILEPEKSPAGGGEPYINANYIKGPDYSNNSYIATQGPLPNTIYEFWIMVHQNITRIATAAGTSPYTVGLEQKIVMLTNFVENGRQKCAIYFPQNEGDWLAFGSTADVDVSEVLSEKDNLTGRFQREAEADGCGHRDTQRLSCESCFFLVQNVSVEQRNGYTVRTLNVIYGARKADVPDDPEGAGEHTEGGSLFELTGFRAHHYWFPDWPDHRSPNDINVLLDLSLDVLGTNVVDTPRPESSSSLKGNQPGTPGLDEVSAVTLNAIPTVLPIVHCSAGIGRTGCLIAILNGLRQLRLSVMVHRRKQQLQMMQLTQPLCPTSDGHDPEVPPTDGGKALADALQDEMEQSVPLPPVPDGADGRRKLSTSQPPPGTINGAGRGPREPATQRESGQVDILGIVCNLRLQRGGMVQNSEQYELIHRALCLYLEKLTQEGHLI